MADPQVRYILFYDYVGDILERRGPYREAHLERIREARDQGQIALAGPLGDPPHGAAIVFTDVGADAVEAWAREDPYIHAGLVTARHVELWKLVA